MQQDGIIHHGRVGHAELHKAYAQAGVWAYPTDFQEISCISAMKAQAYGAFPVTTNYAALKETVRNYGRKVDVDITEAAGQEEYKKTLVEFLKGEEPGTAGCEECRQKMMEDARNVFGWDRVAQQWQEMFTGGSQEGGDK